MPDAVATGDVNLDGNLDDLVEFFGLLTQPQGFFNIVTP